MQTSNAMPISYEEQRIQNIRDNEALLLSLGLQAPPFIKKAAFGKMTPTSSLKRRIEDRDLINNLSPSKTPRLRIADDGSTSSPRRSTRTSGRKVDYSNDIKISPESDPKRDREDAESDIPVERIRMRNAKSMGMRTHDPKTFGHISGVEIGRWWPTRMEASTDAVHAPTVAGISGNAIDGAYSVALSGGYPDDIDLGVAFTYTGCGGRDLKGTKQNPKNLRTALQTSHQSFDWPMNAALRRSAETRKPVRVIRGFKLDSSYAPLEGYRYDGLYVVEKAWMGKGLTRGLMVCRYAFKRVSGQPQLIERAEVEEEVTVADSDTQAIEETKVDSAL